MTPSQLEHLKLIDAHLERLLSIAEKRTPGEWKQENGFENEVWGGADLVSDCIDNATPNATFIASCAGNAEAGWRATLAAIKALSVIAEEKEPVEHGDSGDGPFVSMFRTSAARFAEETLQHILSSFPLELIQKP